MLHHRYRRKHVGAFTLLELLIVVAIIAVLSALAIPAVSSMRERGWLTQSTHNIRQLAIANLAYVADNGRYVPAENIRTNNKRWCGARDNASDPWDPTRGYLSEYLGESRKVTPCPLFTDMLKGDQSFEDGSGGYGYNSTYIGGQPDWAMEPDGTRIPATMAQVGRTTSTVMFTTAAYARADGVQEYPYAEPPFWDFGNGPSSWRPSPTVHFRFNGKAIVAWADGHTSLEEQAPRAEGTNPHGGNATKQNLGWFGPDEQNGFWNPNRTQNTIATSY